MPNQSCGSCSRENPQDASFCMYCGAVLPGSQPWTQPQHQQVPYLPPQPDWLERLGAGWVAAIVAGFLAVVGLIAFLVLAGDGEPTRVDRPEVQTATGDPGTTATSRVPWGAGSGVCDDGAPGSLVVKLYEPEPIPDGSRMTNPRANKLVAILVEIGNEGPHKNAFEVVPDAWFFLTDTEGFIYSCQTGLQEDKPELAAQTLNWGETVEGYVVFEIPDGAEPAEGICAPFASDYWLTWSE